MYACFYRVFLLKIFDNISTTLQASSLHELINLQEEPLAATWINCSIKAYRKKIQSITRTLVYLKH